MSSENPKVIIVGGGFGGLYAAKTLAGKPVDVALIDRKNHHTFQPLLYQVATSVLSPGEIAAPLRRILHKARNVEVVLGEVTGFDLKRKNLTLKDGSTLSFDYLLVSAGARHSYFGHDEWEKDAPGLKTVEDALEIRRRVLLAFEIAERDQYLTGTHKPLNFAVIGGGPTGVEIAGAIADIAKRAMASDFKAIRTSDARVTIYEGASRVLGTYPEKLSRKAEEQLKELGVDVCLNSLVTAVEPGRIRVGNDWKAANVSIWATGVAASPLGKLLGAETDRAGRVHVSPDLSLPGHPDIFVIGDMAFLKDASGKVVPGLGAAATQQGRAAAKNVLRRIEGRETVSFTYNDKGSMATIGRNRAIAEIGRWQLSGYIAWLMWALVHVLLLIGYRNRLSVMTEWIWAYFTRERSARLITDLEDSPGYHAPQEPIASPTLSSGDGTGIQNAQKAKSTIA
jgi:NADH dehydrogenase